MNKLNWSAIENSHLHNTRKQGYQTPKKEREKKKI